MGPLTGEHRPRIRAPWRWSAQPSLPRSGRPIWVRLLGSTGRAYARRGGGRHSRVCPDPAALYGSAYWGAPAAHTRAVEVVGTAESAPIRPPYMGPLTGEHRPRIRAPWRWSARPSLTRCRHGATGFADEL